MGDDIFGGAEYEAHGPSLPVLRALRNTGQHAHYRVGMSYASMGDLQELDLRIGTVTGAQPNTGSRDPALCLWIDLGSDRGIVQSSAKITERYSPEAIIGRQVVVVAGFEPMRIGGFRSDVLVLGALDPDGVVLLRPDVVVADGTPIA
jgi:tRNA-binding protein